MRRAQLNELPSWPAAVLVVLVAVLTLCLRIVALFVALAADGTDRMAGLAASADEALTRRWGIAPVGSTLAVVDADPGIWQSRAAR